MIIAQKSSKYVVLFFATIICLGFDSKPDDNRSEKSTDLVNPKTFTPGVEGPAVDGAGNIYAVNFARQHTIGMVTPAGKASLFVELPKGSTGNGIRFNQQRQMFIADYTGHNILKVEMSTKKISIYAHNDKMNQPNDLAITKKGILFASDPNWKEGTGQLWRINLDGSTTLLEKNMGTTNGIEVSPDEKTLYVSESKQLTVWAYDLSPKGAISNKRQLIKFPDHGSDGMRCDAVGNIYLTRYGKGAVAVISPKGKVLREIQLTGKKPSNITFGGKDGKTCYVTMADRGNLEVFRANVAGRSYQMRSKK